MGRIRWAIVAALVVLGIVISATTIQSITTCNSCPSNPCPCTTDYRIGARLLILAVFVLAAVAFWLVTRRRASS